MIRIERDHAERLVALLLGCTTPENFSDTELQVLIGNTFAQYNTTHRFSIALDGKDLRSTIIDQMVKHHSTTESHSPDPATMADEIMVTLGFNSGYDEDGDYAPGYREYAINVGLIQEDPKLASDFIEKTGEDLIEAAKEQAVKNQGSAAQQAKWTEINDNWGVTTWKIREDGVMIVKDDDGDKYEIDTDGNYRGI